MIFPLLLFASWPANGFETGWQPLAVESLPFVTLCYHPVFHFSLLLGTEICCYITFYILQQPFPLRKATKSNYRAQKAARNLKSTRGQRSDLKTVESRLIVGNVLGATSIPTTVAIGQFVQIDCGALLLCEVG